MLSATALLDVDGFIADWNVRRYEQGARVAVDVRYLASLEAGSLPALARLVEIANQNGDRPTAEHASRALQRRLDEERLKLQSWQSWTWRRAESVRRAEAIRQTSSPSANIEY